MLSSMAKRLELITLVLVVVAEVEVVVLAEEVADSEVAMTEMVGIVTVVDTVIDMKIAVEVFEAVEEVAEVLAAEVEVCTKKSVKKNHYKKFLIPIINLYKNIAKYSFFLCAGGGGY